MPFCLRKVTPVSVCNRPLPDDVDNVLEAMSNQALSGVLRQMASVFLLADSLMESLLSQLQSVATRTEALQTRLETFSAVCLRLDARSVVVPESDLATAYQQQHRPIMSTEVAKVVFSEETRPQALQNLYNSCHLSPAVRLRHIDPFRRDGVRSSRMFRCMPTMADTEPDNLLDIETRVPAEVENMPSWVPTVDILAPIHPDSRLNMVKPMSKAITCRLPTINQLAMARARLSRAETVAIDTSATSFQRLAQLRRSLPQMNYSRMKQKRKSRRMRSKTGHNKTANDESTQNDLETNDCETPTSLESTNGNSASCSKVPRGWKTRGDTDSGRGSHTSHRASSDLDTARRRHTSAQHHLPAHVRLLEDADDASSAFSCDAEGYYTSFHCDSGLKPVENEDVDGRTTLEDFTESLIGSQRSLTRQSRKKTPPPPPARSSATLLSCYSRNYVRTAAELNSSNRVNIGHLARDSSDSFIDNDRPSTIERTDKSKTKALPETSVVLETNTEKQGKYESSKSRSLGSIIDNITVKNHQFHNSFTMKHSQLRRHLSKRFQPQERPTNVVTKSELDKKYLRSIVFHSLCNFLCVDSCITENHDYICVNVQESILPLIEKFLRDKNRSPNDLEFVSVTFTPDTVPIAAPFTSRKFEKQLREIELKRLAAGRKLSPQEIKNSLQPSVKLGSILDSFHPGDKVRTLGDQLMFPREMLTAHQLCCTNKERPMCPIPLKLEDENDAVSSSSDSVASEGALRPFFLYDERDQYCEDQSHTTPEEIRCTITGDCLSSSYLQNPGGIISVLDLSTTSVRFSSQRSSSRTSISSCPDFTCQINEHLCREIEWLASNHITVQELEKGDNSKQTIKLTSDELRFKYQKSWSEPLLHMTFMNSAYFSSPFHFCDMKGEALCQLNLDDLMDEFCDEDPFDDVIYGRERGDGVFSKEWCSEMMVLFNDELGDVEGTEHPPAIEKKGKFTKPNSPDGSCQTEYQSTNSCESNFCSQQSFAMAPAFDTSMEFETSHSWPNINCENSLSRLDKSRIPSLPTLPMPIDVTVCNQLLLQYTPSPEGLGTQSCASKASTVDENMFGDSQLLSSQQYQNDRSGVDPASAIYESEGDFPSSSEKIDKEAIDYRERSNASRHSLVENMSPNTVMHNPNTISNENSSFSTMIASSSNGNTEAKTCSVATSKVPLVKPESQGYVLDQHNCRGAYINMQCDGDLVSFNAGRPPLLSLHSVNNSSTVTVRRNESYRLGVSSDESQKSRFSRPRRVIFPQKGSLSSGSNKLRSIVLQSDNEQSTGNEEPQNREVLTNDSTI